ncbi:hypothetical protein TPA0910_66080 [Streptomyces hygroscopicus subsp. sporocinereus]|uniref:Uncharacterized protein n=1 Tax=Streptomyces hygroscopicus TaxID=1912 RepID=A0ABQ3U993_STRHY|nr:hypothetical protein TPA0910_66080 [Streptomyces hygroscopicus]
MEFMIADPWGSWGPDPRTTGGSGCPAGRPGSQLVAQVVRLRVKDMGAALAVVLVPVKPTMTEPFVAIAVVYEAAVTEPAEPFWVGVPAPHVADGDLARGSRPAIRWRRGR